MVYKKRIGALRLISAATEIGQLVKQCPGVGVVKRVS